MQRRAPRRFVPRQSTNSTPLIITNQCSDDIYPGIGTQSGTGPSVHGFRLAPGEQRSLTVSENWQGRVWGRANCSFNADGTAPSNNTQSRACGSGDCNGVLNCQVGGDTPTTLAEITLDAGDGHTYYDISLVDGYNLPMAIEVESAGDPSLADYPPNLTNPCCSGTAGLLAPQNWYPYVNDQTFIGTNSTYQLPLDTSIDNNAVLNWCPWDLQENMPAPPADGVYTYPDSSMQRPAFNPCLSACAKYNRPADCCTGQYNSPSSCQPSNYSKAAKKICPDAYSYAFDDTTSTFVIPTGAGFNVIFCPGGRSSIILNSMSSNVSHRIAAQVLVLGEEVETQEGDEDYNMRSYYYHGHMNHGPTKRDDYNWTGIGAAYMPIEGVRISEMKRRGLYLTAWAEARRREVMREDGPMWSIFKKRSSAAAMSTGEVKSPTWYLMCGGLSITAAIFIML